MIYLVKVWDLDDRRLHTEVWAQTQEQAWELMQSYLRDGYHVQMIPEESEPDCGCG